MQIKPNKRPYATTKVTRENIDLILEDIRNLAPNKYAAESNGISEAHFYDLLKQGICDINHGNYDTLHAYLAKSLREIEKKEIISCRKDIRRSEKGHIGAQWTLEHAFWRSFCGDAKVMELAHEIEMMKGELGNEVCDQKGSEKGDQEVREKGQEG
jgi:hypothetical protein